VKQLDVRRTEELLAKERAHDDYLEAIRGVHAKAMDLRAALPAGEPFDNFRDGYEAALWDLAQAIVAACRRRINAIGGG